MSLWFAFLALFFGCSDYTQNGPYPVEGTTWRVEPPKPHKDSQVTIQIFANREDCKRAHDDVAADETPLCIPRIDRGTGQVEFAFRLLDKVGGDNLRLSLGKDELSLAHEGRPITSDTEWDLIPHGPSRAGQLFIVIIDGSASIYTTGGIEKIRKALMNPKVIDSFLPPGQKTSDAAAGVMLLRFSEDVQTIDSQDPQKNKAIITDQKAYKQIVQQYLTSGKRGFSHVYQAVTFAATTLVQSPEVRQWLQIHQAQPIIVLLTDGFNNENAKDTCADNVPRLESALDVLRKAREGAGTYSPVIYTVGLGTAMQPGFKAPANGRVSAEAICKNYGDKVINGGLEEIGIDNPSLAYLADVGGGKTYTKKNHQGLAEVFLEAAAMRYRWYEIRYRIDPFFLRESFVTRIRLNSFARGEASMRFLPSAWLDTPSGLVSDNDRWFVPQPLRQSLVLVIDILGVLVFLGFVGPALFNARRAFFRRARGKK